MPKDLTGRRQKNAKRRLEEAGALLLIGWQKNSASEILELLEEFRPAGFIYFRRNWPGGLVELKETIDEVNIRASSFLKRPLIWALDQEGGTVQRLDGPNLDLPSASEITKLAQEAGLAKVSELTYKVGKSLKEIGFNFNLAPVLDVRFSKSYIASRSFSHDPKLAGEVALSYAEGFKRAGVILCGKHFPGLGSSVVDPHKDLPLVNDTVQVLWERDGLPFRELIRQGISAIMTTHAIYHYLDPHLPATFSKVIISLLKQDYGFEGLAITDDLEMEGIMALSTTHRAAVEAIAAGHDLAIVSKEYEKIKASRDALAKAIDDSHIPPNRLKEASSRLKKTLKQVALCK